MKRLWPIAFLMIILILPLSLAVVAPSSSVSISSSTSSFSTSFSVSSSDAITFDTGYYSVDGSQWQSFALSGSNLDSDWLSGSASGSFVVDRSSADQNVYVIVFTCSLVNSAWDCHGSDWQILEGVVAALAQEEDPTPPPQVDGNAWSDPSTWSSMGMSVPQAGDVVMIPQGERVVLDVSPPFLDGIMVNGVLEFADTDLAVTTDYIKVMGQGAELIIGTEAEPYTGDAVITLTGSKAEVLDAEANDDHCGSKVICSMGGGRMEMISDYAGPSWTRLRNGNTADVGDTTIRLEENVGWQVGDEIVIVSTDYDPTQAEKRTITAVNGDTVSFSQPLQFMHYGEIQNIEGYSVDQRAEVIHLTRNIRIQGDSSSTNSQIGGHMMAMNEHHLQQMQEYKNGAELVDLWERDNNNPAYMPKIDGIELYRMGQQGILARYPWHWHLYGDASGSYVKNTAVHESFQRCYTIHGTQNALLEDSVAYDTVGHCVFLEDGAEWDNTVRRNAIALTRMFQSSDNWLIESDELPSSFWWSNSQNDIYDNVAAGGFGIGFWLDPKDHPDGPSATTSIDIGNVRDGEWGDYSGNVAHSYTKSVYEDIEKWTRVSTHVKSKGNFRGGTGFFVGDDRRNRVGDNNPQESNCNTICDVDNLHVHHTQTGYKSMRTFTQRPINSLITDTWQGIITVEKSNEDNNVVIAYTNNLGNIGQWGQGNIPLENDVDVSTDNQFANQIGRSSPLITISGGARYVQYGINWKYDGGNSQDHTFINFHDEGPVNRGAVTTSTHTHSVLMRGSELIRSDAYVIDKDSDDDTGSIIRDIDGTLSGTGQYSELREITGNARPLLYDSTCQQGTDGDDWHVCTGVSGKYRHIGLAGNLNQVEQISSGKTMNVAGNEFTHYLPMYETYMMNMPTGDNGAEMHLIHVGDDQWVIAAFPSNRPLAPTANKRNQQYYASSEVSRATTPNQLCASDSKVTVYYDPSRNIQYIKMFGGADLSADFMSGDKWQYRKVLMDSHESAGAYSPANSIVEC